MLDQSIHMMLVRNTGSKLLLNEQGIDTELNHLFHGCQSRQSVVIWTNIVCKIERRGGEGQGGNVFVVLSSFSYLSCVPLHFRDHAT